MMEFRFEPVPPPDHAPVDEIGETLGLCDGLRAKRGERMYRCAQCGVMQEPNAWQVWVPDRVRKNDPDWAVTEAARLNAFNGHFSAWCLSCAPKKPKAAKGKGEPAAPDPVRKKWGIFAWLFR